MRSRHRFVVHLGYDRSDTHMRRGAAAVIVVVEDVARIACSWRLRFQDSRFRAEGPAIVASEVVVRRKGNAPLPRAGGSRLFSGVGMTTSGDRKFAGSARLQAGHSEHGNRFMTEVQFTLFDT